MGLKFVTFLIYLIIHPYMQVTQVECSSKRLAPSGCLQYFTQDSGEIQTFNYNSGNGVHLANQDYSACVRSDSLG